MTPEQQQYYEDLQDRVSYLFDLINEAEKGLQAGEIKEAYHALMSVKRQLPRTELAFGVLMNGLV